jgi:hypothetical protein
MAVEAGLVAAVADIDLQRLQSFAAYRRKAAVLEPGQGGVHVVSINVIGCRA